jgi:hypothetical protein
MSVQKDNEAMARLYTEGVQDKKYDKCWDGYKKVPGKKRGDPGSCEKAEDAEEEWSDEDAEDRLAGLPEEDAEYKGRKVTLNKPTRGDVKKFKVYVKDPKTGNVKKVNFGDPNMRIRKSNPGARKSFRARHKCDQKKDKTTPGFWACKSW